MYKLLRNPSNLLASFMSFSIVCGVDSRRGVEGSACFVLEVRVVVLCDFLLQLFLGLRWFDISLLLFQEAVQRLLELISSSYNLFRGLQQLPVPGVSRRLQTNAGVEYCNGFSAEVRSYGTSLSQRLFSFRNREETDVLIGAIFARFCKPDRLLLLRSFHGSF